MFERISIRSFKELKAKFVKLPKLVFVVLEHVLLSFMYFFYKNL